MAVPWVACDHGAALPPNEKRKRQSLQSPARQASRKQQTLSVSSARMHPANQSCKLLSHSAVPPSPFEHFPPVVAVQESRAVHKVHCRKPVGIKLDSPFL